MSAYQYTIECKAGKQNANADSLSRLPLPDIPVEVPVPEETVFLMDTLQDPVSVAQIRRWTDKDPILVEVRNLLKDGWHTDSENDDLNPYSRCKDELSIQEGCIMRAIRIIVPKPGQQLILQELHAGHQGISKMKSLARSFVWWPNLDSDIEKTAELPYMSRKSENTS